MTVLRPYQIDMIRSVVAAYSEGRRRILAQLPTGGGKTVIFASLTKAFADDGRRVLILAHRRELVAQAHDKLFAVGVDAGIIQAGVTARPEVPVQIASVQTLFARAIRTRKIDLPAADLVIVDEAHHVRAKTWQKILDGYPDALVLGVTATPCRSDGRGLGNFFDILISGPSVGVLVEKGHLVPTVTFAPTTPDLKGVKTRAGDYVEKDLAARMDQAELVGDIVTHYHRLARGRRAVVFATGVAHSIHLRDEFRNSGVPAEHIDGTTPTEARERILKQLETGEIDVVTNAMVLTEGWDCPSVSACILARPTRQIGLFLQMVGRVLRPAPGKTDALILDHAGAVFAHGFAEDEIAWALATDKRAENLTQKAQPGSPAGRLTTCPECSAIRTAGQACRACGWQPERRPEAVVVAEGDLGRVDRQRHAHAEPIDRDRWHAELAGVAAERGYQRGWIGHKYREKFGTWPSRRQITPIAPSKEVISWVRSRNIAYAKARAKVG
jgi:DNA repair protein RadD